MLTGANDDRGQRVDNKMAVRGQRRAGKGRLEITPNDNG